VGALNIDRLHAVSSRLGETVVDPGCWPILMDEICRAVGTTGAGLLQSDVRTSDIPTTESAVELFKAYFDNNLHVSDVRAIRGVPLLLAGASVVTDQDLFANEQDMLRDPLYATLGHVGFRWWAAVGFKAGSALWGLSLQRTPREGPFEAEEKNALAQLSRRLTETATLSKAVGRQVLAGMTNALHHVGQAALALDSVGFVIDANGLAAGHFDDDIRVRNRRLCVRDKRAQSDLDRFVDQLKTTPNTAALPVEPIVVRRETKRPVVIRIMPVDGAARNPFLNARALLILTDMDASPGPELSGFSQVFELTPAETRLAALIAKGTSSKQAAEQLGIAHETARSQLKSVFAKTGTHRQSELVLLISRF
jgi:DNA-binding CsgD family transcriptional regulator